MIPMMTSAGKNSVLLVVRMDLLGIIHLPRMLKAAGGHVTLFAPKGVAIAKSRFVDRRIIASASSFELIQQLKAHLSEHQRNYQWIIIGDETLLHDIAKQKGEAWLDGWFPVDHRNRAVELITSKFPFLQASAEAGLPVPKFQICSDFAEARRVGNGYGYPLILKQPTGMSGSGVRKVWGPDDFAPQFEMISGGQPVMVQQYVTGLRGQTEVLFDHGRPLCWESSYTLSSWPTELAASCVRQVMDHPAIEPLLTGIGALTGFHGFGGVDWVVDQSTGQLSLIEFNARPTPGWHTSKDLPAALTGMFNGALEARPSLPATAPQARAPSPDGSAASEDARASRVYMFPQCAYRAIDDLNLPLLIRACSNLPWNDPGLLLALVRRIASHYAPVGLRRWAKGLVGRASVLF